MTLDFAHINESILAGRDIDENVVAKDEVFYTYLLNNRIAYYYATELSTHETAAEALIKQRAEVFHDRYVRSLAVIKQVCEESGLDYLLYKTHPYVPQLADGDIDLLFRPHQFDLFMKAMGDRDFQVEVDEVGKGKCIHPGFAVIEPHINVSWRGVGCASEELLWSEPLEAMVSEERYPTASYEVELLSLAAKVVFEPAYLDLYSLKVIRHIYDSGVDETKMLQGVAASDSIEEVLRFAKCVESAPVSKLPAFLPFAVYMRLWTKHFLESRDARVYLLHIAYFTYWKYRYALRDRLPFTHHHEW